jgi:hypothetical protein
MPKLPAEPKVKYGAKFDASLSDLDIEFACIQNGGQWQMMKDGVPVTMGLGLFEHYRNAQRIIWPDDDEHKWTELVLNTVVNNDVSVIMGASDTGKTYPISKFVLTDWWAFPDKTLWMVSSTERRGAELRNWGAIKQLFNSARARHPSLPGTVLESMACITTEAIDDNNKVARLLTKGIIFIPCKVGGKFVSLGAYLGIKGGTKNARIGHFGDETQAMQRSFLDAYSNWYGKQYFKGIMAGNPMDLEDCLCIAGEPVDGWNTWKDNEKTQTWRSKFYDAAVVALDGRDSPNMDLPEGSPVKFKYLIGRKKIKAVELTHGKDSWQYHSQCTGKPRPGAMARRVISRQLCDERHAFDDVIWGTEPTIRIMGCDAAYGGVGGDRCVAGHIEFGKDVDGNMTLACNPPVIVPVAVSKKGLPEEQIAQWCKDYAESFNIPPGNFYFDGRGTLAVYLGRIWSPDVNSVEFGGKPTDRPVSMDEFIWDGDTKTRRLKRCDEHYSKFVTELWFSLFYIIAAGQMRRLPMDVAEEGWRREWRKVKGDRIEVETKEDMKLRTGQSPDLFDWLAICGEGARRKGFEIRNTSNTEPQQGEDENWLEDELKRYMKELRKTQLRYV